MNAISLLERAVGSLGFSARSRPHVAHRKYYRRSSRARGDRPNLCDGSDGVRQRILRTLTAARRIRFRLVCSDEKPTPTADFAQDPTVAP